MCAHYIYIILEYRKGKVIAMKKKSRIIFIVIVITLLGVATSQAMQVLGLPNTSDKTLAATSYRQNFSDVMVGEKGEVLLIDSINDKEYTEMMSLLYPNCIVDSFGQDIPEINNFTEFREKFVAEHTRAYSLVGEKTSEVKLIPFKISITDKSNGKYESLFYKTTIGSDNFVFPSEWGNQSCGFIHISEKNIYLAYTDMGIWRIDPEKLSAIKISSDTYSGRTQDEISNKIMKIYPEWYLTWIDSVKISPDGSYIVYRTNRDSALMNETSVWGIDLKTGEERQLIPSSYNNDIVGFITDSHIVVGALGDTRMMDIKENMIISVDIPKLPNFSISEVRDGRILFSSYEDGNSNSTTWINSIDVLTGKVTEIMSITGYLDGEPRFSPSGNKVAIGYGSDPMVGVVDVLIVDLSTKSQMLLTDSLKNTSAVKGNIIRFHWVNDDTVLVDAQQGSELSSFIIK